MAGNHAVRQEHEKELKLCRRHLSAKITKQSVQRQQRKLTVVRRRFGVRQPQQRQKPVDSFDYTLVEVIGKEQDDSLGRSQAWKTALALAHTQYVSERLAAVQPTVWSLEVLPAHKLPRTFHGSQQQKKRSRCLGNGSKYGGENWEWRNWELSGEAAPQYSLWKGFKWRIKIPYKMKSNNFPSRDRSWGGIFRKVYQVKNTGRSFYGKAKGKRHAVEK